LRIVFFRAFSGRLSFGRNAPSQGDGSFAWPGKDFFCFRVVLTAGLGTKFTSSFFFQGLPGLSRIHNVGQSQGKKPTSAVVRSSMPA